MKIKTDFVTNSSSSSFILVVKKGITKKEFASLFDKTKLVGDIFEYSYDDDELAFNEIAKKDATPDLLLNAMYRGLTNLMSHGIDMGDWVATGGEGSSEDGVNNILDFFYICGIPDDSDLLKVAHWC